MREIKFRAWDKKNKQMFYQSAQYLQSFLRRVNLLCTDEQHSHDKYADKDLMQYTGLKDKNGKEIYEGDVVKIHNLQEKWKRGEPDFDWRIFEIVWKKYTWAFYNSSLQRPLADYDVRTLQSFEIEIIGNIHENPELLEV